MNVKFVFRMLLLAVISLFFNSKTLAQGLSLPAGGMQYFLYGAVTFVLVSFSFAIYFLTLKNKYQKAAEVKKGARHEASGLRKMWSNLDKKFFTKAAPLEREADVLLDHDYDGIKELDNALPPWWKWGFYFTIVVAIVYLLRFHVTGSGPTPLQEYDNEMRAAATKMENFKKNSKEAFDEATVTLADAAGIASGKKIFVGTCVPCHGGNGEGNAVGPNLADKYWLHGGSLGNIFKTITNGVPEKGMQAWGKTFSPTDVRNLSSFILSLQGTKPSNARAPQGILYEQRKSTDSTIARKDPLQVKTTE